MKRAIVFGLARSGVGAAKLLGMQGYAVTVTDMKPRQQLEKFVAELPATVELALGGHPEGLFDGASLVVVSPGVPMNIAPLKAAYSMGIEVIGELELGARALAGVPFYAITGTNGKSTTTTILDLMMKNSGRKSLLAGNIGWSLCSEAADVMASKILPECVVVEVSSFQLDGIKGFRPKVASILNITPDHLDRYKDMSGYRDSKAMVAMNQRAGDALVLNADDPQCVAIASEIEASLKADERPEIFYFSRKSQQRGMWVDGHAVMFDLPGIGSGQLINASEIAIKGVHNLENAMAASLMALLAGGNVDAIIKSLREFTGLPHRLELVRELNGVRYINDSKGTNVDAVLKSLEGFTEPVVLIAGGRDKAGDFAALRELLKQKARAVVLIGEASDKIEKAVGNAVQCHRALDMAQAVRMASEIAKRGDAVLLSPACASFDMFRDYEHRGEVFAREVRAL